MRERQPTSQKVFIAMFPPQARFWECGLQELNISLQCNVFTQPGEPCHHHHELQNHLGNSKPRFKGTIHICVGHCKRAVTAFIIITLMTHPPPPHPRHHHQDEGDSIGSAGSLAQPRSVPEVWGEEGELSGRHEDCDSNGCNDGNNGDDNSN